MWQNPEYLNIDFIFFFPWKNALFQYAILSQV